MQGVCACAAFVLGGGTERMVSTRLVWRSGVNSRILRMLHAQQADWEVSSARHLA